MPTTSQLFARLWSWLLPIGTPVTGSTKPVDEPLPVLGDEPNVDDVFRPAPYVEPSAAVIIPPWRDISDAGVDYANDPRILQAGPLVVILTDGRALCRVSQSHVWRLYRNNRPLGGYWYRLDTALGHLLGHPQGGRNKTKDTALALLAPDDPQLPAEEAPNA